MIRCLISVVEVAHFSFANGASELVVVVASDLSRSRRRSRIPQVATGTPDATHLHSKHSSRQLSCPVCCF